MSKDKIYIDGVNVANCEYLDEMFSGMHFCKAKGNMFFCTNWDGCPYKQLQAKKKLLSAYKNIFMQLSKELEQELYNLKIIQLKQILDLSPNLSDKIKEMIKKIIRIKKERRK